MSSKELEIKLKATGGDAAAAEVEKVEKAVDGLSEMSPAWDATTAATEKSAKAIADVAQEAEELGDIDAAAEWLERITEGTGDAGESTADYAGQLQGLLGTLGKLPGPLGQMAGSLGKVVGMAGQLGPHAAVLAALGAGAVQLTKAIIDHLDEVEAAANRAMPALASTSMAAAVEAERLAQAEERVAEALKQNDANVKNYTAGLRALANEQAGLVDAELGANLAQIDLDELQGNLTEAEAITARFSERQAASGRKLALEREQLETELKNQQMQNALELDNYNKAAGPAAQAQAELNQLTGRGASAAPGLEDKVAARNAANKARGEATTTDPEELDALDAAITDAQDALAEAYREMVEKKTEEVKALVDKAREASDRVSAGRSAATALSGELDSMNTGTGAQAEAARRREDELRKEAELLRVQQKADAEQAKREADEAKARAEENARGVNQSAKSLADDIAGQVAAAPNAGADDSGLLAALTGIAKTLSNGTDTGELAAVAGDLAAAAAKLSSDQTAARAVVSNLQQQVDNLTSRLNSQ